MEINILIKEWTDKELDGDPRTLDTYLNCFTHIYLEDDYGKKGLIVAEFQAHFLLDILGNLLNLNNSKKKKESYHMSSYYNGDEYHIEKNNNRLIVFEEDETNGRITWKLDFDFKRFLELYVKEYKKYLEYSYRNDTLLKDTRLFKLAEEILKEHKLK